MLVLVQRVLWAQVETAGAVVGRIERGLLVYAAIAVGDTVADARRLADKIVGLRIFDDQQGKLNLSVQDIRGGVLAISNFTLLADARKGRRPSFEAAAQGEVAQPVHEVFVSALKCAGCNVAAGVFGAEMTIQSAADGPVNVLVALPPCGQLPCK